MKKFILTMTAIFMLSAVGFAQSGTAGPLTWDLSNGILTISGEGAMPDYSHLDYYDQDYAPWYDYSSLIKTVVIGDSVTTIGNEAFYCYWKLTSVTIPNSVTSIGDLAFYDCRSLTDITIPNSVTIGVGAFDGCSGLTSVTWDISNGILTISGEGDMADYSYPPYYHPASAPWYDYSSLIKTVVIGDSVTSIGDMAFCVGNYDFVGFHGLTSVTIGNSVTSIGNMAFHGCSELTSVTIGNSVTSIGGGAFWSCDGLTSVTIPNSVTSIGSGAFEDCRELTSVTIPNSVTSIGNWAFKGTPYYNNQPDGVVYINDVLYNYKGNMPGGTVVNVREGTVSISPDAFYNCSGLTSVTIPNSVTSIGGDAFEGCSGLTSVTIPYSVTSIEDRAFNGCSKLPTIDVSENNTAYASENGVLFNKAKSALIQYPAGKQDASYTIPNSVTSIGNRAFYWCSRLTEITIGNNVTSIGIYAFFRCSGLTKIHSKNIIPPVCEKYSFSDVDKKTCTIYIPKGSYSAYSVAPGWSEFDNIIELTAPKNKFLYYLLGVIFLSILLLILKRKKQRR